MPRVVVLGVFLAAYGNVGSLILGNGTPAGGWPGVVIGALPLGVALAFARRGERLTASEFGLTWRNGLSSAGLGLLLALAAAAAALVFLHFPPLVGQSVAFTPLESLPRQDLLWRAFFWMPLDTAIPEELSFRGVLLALLRRRVPDTPAVLLSAVVFTAWHGVIVSRTVALTNLQTEPLLETLGVIGAFAAVCVGGVLFAWLRLRTRHLAGSIVAHWAFNAAVLLGLGA